MKRTGILFLLLFGSMLLVAQSSRIETLDASLQGDDVLIRWSLNAGSVCLSLQIERSSDNVNYTSIYDFPGICGSEDEATSYSYIDPSPKAYAVNYYRLRVENVELTEVVRIDNQSHLANDEIIVFPNPLRADRTINFDFRNSRSEVVQIRIIDASGKVHYESEEMRRDLFQLQPFLLPSGLYFFKITTEEGRTLCRKFMVTPAS